MSDSQFSQLENQIEILNTHLDENNLDSFETDFIEFDRNVRNLFSAINNMPSESVKSCEKIFIKFETLLKRAEGMKQDVARKIGAHLSNQKKLNVYKSIK